MAWIKVEDQSPQEGQWVECLWLDAAGRVTRRDVARHCKRAWQSANCLRRMYAPAYWRPWTPPPLPE